MGLEAADLPCSLFAKEHRDAELRENERISVGQPRFTEQPSRTPSLLQYVVIQLAPFECPVHEYPVQPRHYFFAENEWAGLL